MKAEIMHRIDTTIEKLKTSFNTFVIDASTECYNETFLREYLINYLSVLKETKVSKNVALVYINIDNIIELNLKYSTETGNEVISNLGFVVKQVISENDLLFKKNGPGFILLVHDCQKNDIREYTSIIQNSVKNSEVFIEPITVSIAVVFLKEIDNSLSPIEKTHKMLEFGQKRINLAPRLGDNSYIDNSTKIEKSSAGNILLVESDDLTKKILKSLLEKNHFTVYAEDDGVSALNLAKKIRFNAIIADRYTIKIDGLTLKRYLNESTINTNSLYILTSQSKNVEVIEKANHINVNYVVKKPIIFEEILGIINRHIDSDEKYL
jgi:diguanylate cyclase (GGDEF)-like protein